MILYAIHGFLGQASDWNFLKLSHPIKSISITPNTSLINWADTFNAEVAKDGHTKRVLMGYSLGGRLAMHALLQNTSLWHGAIIVSSNPGIESTSIRKEKLLQDDRWAKRFESEAWDSVLSSWNGQPVFKEDKGFNRQEADYKRADLANMLRVWSVGNQEYLLPKINQLPIAKLFITGENDVKYTEIAKEATAHCPHSKLWIAPEASHRVPWQQPKKFQEQVSQFLKGINL